MTRYKRPPDLGIPMPRLRWGDLFDEISRSIFHRPMRSLLTALGTVLGVGTLVCTVGLTQTAAAQVSSRFDALEATKIVVKDRGQSSTPPFPEDALERLRRTSGVVAVGESWSIPATVPVRTFSGTDATHPPVSLTVVALDQQTLTAVDAEVGAGRAPDPFAVRTSAPIVLVGKGAAEQLGLGQLTPQRALVVGSQTLTIVGIMTAAPRRPELLSAVMVVPGVGERLLRAQGSRPEQPQHELTVKVRPGAAQAVGEALPYILSPQDPQRYDSQVPPSAAEFRAAVQGDLGGVFYVLGIVSLGVGILGIANSGLVAVMQRTREFGIRRALGAKGSDIARQVLVEAAVIGLLGGLTGLAAGLVVIVGTAFQQQWTPALNPLVMTATPGLGLAVGVVAGIYPAWRASRIEPLEALRQ
jgi:putative ABC transport system permease protein